jgi:thioredoxin 1
MPTLPNTSDQAFDADVLKSGIPVLVDFGAEWCHPCRQLDPIVETLADEWQGRVKVLHLDIDANVQTTMRFGVMGVPTLILFAGGQEQERLTGFQPRKRILERLGPHLGL